MMLDRMKNNNKLKYIVCFAIAALFLFIYQSIYWNKIYPITDGWGLYFSDLIQSGKVPYRDFYYYLPPFNLLMDTVLWKLSFGYLLIYRIYRIIERFIILFLLYKLLCKVTEPFWASIGSFMGILLSTATVYDLCGDYNQTVDMIPIILGFLLLRYLECADNSNSFKQYQCLAYIGILIGFAFLLKQTVFVATLIVAFFSLTVLYVINNRFDFRGYMHSIVATFVGVIIPVVPTLLFLQIKGALIPFFEQVFFNGGSKGSIGDVLLSIFRITLEYRNVYTAVTIAFCFYMLSKERIKGKLLYVFIMLSTFYFSFKEKIDSIIALKDTDKGYPVIIGFIVILIVSFLIDVFSNGDKWKRIFISFFIFGMTALLLWFQFFETSCQRLYNETNLFSLISDITILCCALCFIIIICLFYKYYKYCKMIYAKWLILFVCAFICLYYSGMTVSNSFNARSLCIVFPVLFCYAMKKIKAHNCMKMSIGFMLCAILVAGVISQKVVNAYSWWGWNEAPLNEEHFYKVNVKAFRGIEFGEDEAIMYNEMFNVLEYNSDNKDTIYSFPHAKIFNVVLNNTNMDDSFVPVPFYDVCSDEYAREDAIRLEKDPPEILIWCDMPNCMETHEEIFRDGKPLGQRSIQRVFKRLIMQDKYTLIGQYNNMFIYKLNNNEKINYTYIQDPLRVNLTLMQK